MKQMITMFILLMVLSPVMARVPMDDPIYVKGSPRPRAPKDWTRFEWPKKKAVLFGQYAPTAEEKKRILTAMPTESLVGPSSARKLLVFYRCQYPHAAIASGCFTFDVLGPASGAYSATLTDDPNAINSENLKQYDALMFNNTTDWDVTIGGGGCQAVLDFVKGGKGLVLIHAGTDSCKKWKEGQQLTGGVFGGHPWIPNAAWAFKIESPGHALNSMFNNQGFWHCEEVYVFRGGATYVNQSRILISLDMSHPQNIDQLRDNYKEKVDRKATYALAWIHNYGKGRVFFSNFGHNFSTYWQTHILQHYLAGIQFALGDLEANTIPSSEMTDTQTALAPQWK